jgi:glutathione S-transferase
VTLTIWGRPNSHNVKKILWFVDEIGIAYERRDMGGTFGVDAAYLAKNPNALIPTIEDDGLVLWESNTILRYLAAKYAPDRFWPADPGARAMAEKWMDWQFGYAAAQYDAFWGLVRMPADQRDADSIARSAEQSGQMMAILDAALARQAWLSGEEFGIGDIPIGAYANSWFSLDIVRPDRPHVSNWYERLKQRPAYARHVMIPLT